MMHGPIYIRFTLKFVYCVLLRYYAASSDNFLPTFRDHLSVSFKGVGSWRGDRYSPETSARNCRYSLHNCPEQRSPHLHRSGRLKSGIVSSFSTQVEAQLSVRPSEDIKLLHTAWNETRALWGSLVITAGHTDTEEEQEELEARCRHKALYNADFNPETFVGGLTKHTSLLSPKKSGRQGVTSVHITARCSITKDSFRLLWKLYRFVGADRPITAVVRSKVRLG